MSWWRADADQGVDWPEDNRPLVRHGTVAIHDAEVACAVADRMAAAHPEETGPDGWLAIAAARRARLERLRAGESVI